MAKIERTQTVETKAPLTSKCLLAEDGIVVDAGEVSLAGLADVPAGVSCSPVSPVLGLLVIVPEGDTVARVVAAPFVDGARVGVGDPAEEDPTCLTDLDANPISLLV